MARPRKRRRVCGLPNYRTFGPMDESPSEDVIILSVEEYEAFRLIDLEGLEQVECAERMEVARSTVQRMYSKAKQKVADCIVNGKVLRIEGGDYVVCKLDPENCTPCNRVGHRHRRGRRRG